MSGPVYEYPWQNPEWGPEWNPHDQCADQIGRLTTELNEARAELEEWKRASGPECGGSPDDVTPQDLEESLDRYRAELESAVSQIAVLREDRETGAALDSEARAYDEVYVLGLIGQRDALAAEVELFRKDVRRIVNWTTSALSGADAWGVCVNEIKAIARPLLKKDGGA